MHGRDGCRARSSPVVHSYIQVSCGARNSNHCTRLYWKHGHGLIYHSLWRWIRCAILRTACMLIEYILQLMQTNMQFNWSLSWNQKQVSRCLPSRFPSLSFEFESYQNKIIQEPEKNVTKRKLHINLTFWELTSLPSLSLSLPLSLQIKVTLTRLFFMNNKIL
jgi:hypothetical protein